MLLVFCLTGIEMKFKNQNYPILIAPTHIPELNAVEHTAGGIKFGASVTLTTLEDVLNEACHSMPGIAFIALIIAFFLPSFLLMKLKK